MRENKEKSLQPRIFCIPSLLQENWPLKADKGKSPVLHVSNLQYRGRKLKAVHKHSEMIIIHLLNSLT